ncbi:MAG TPA: LLM class flavin-dependent oxidoreductase [Micromonosporaceae bacterium]|nr:LLM class flavin-dependent oxidoreductase [Micromonosporaceae bacterium]
MYLSIFVGPFSRDARDDAAVVDLCIDQASRAASAGFAMVTFGEQHFNDYEPYCNPFIMAGHMAGQLGEAWFGTTIVPLPFHHPLRLAEDASVADLLTRGKFLLGMSAGRVGPVPDWDNFGIDPRDRDALFASNFEILEKAFLHAPGDAPLRYETKWGRGALNGRLMPASWRDGGPLMAIGSNTDSTIANIGARGLPLLLGPCPPAVAAHKMGLHRSAMRSAGFSDDVIGTARTRSLVTRNVIVAETDDEAWELAERLSGDAPFMDRTTDGRSMREMADFDLSTHQFQPPVFGSKGDPIVRNSTYVQGWLIVGDPSSVTTQIKQYEAVGIPHLNVRFTVGRFDPDRGTPDLFERSFALFLEEVAPQLELSFFAPIADDEVRPAYRT